MVRLVISPDPLYPNACAVFSPVVVTFVSVLVAPNVVLSNGDASAPTLAYVNVYASAVAITFVIPARCGAVPAV